MLPEPKGGKKNSSLLSPANCSRRAAFQATLKSRVQGSAVKRGAIFFPVTVYSFCGSMLFRSRPHDDDDDDDDDGDGGDDGDCKNERKNELQGEFP